MGEPIVRARVGVDYGRGRLLDIYEAEPPGESVGMLLWHGSGANERDVLEPLARQLAAAGVTTVVPDWSCHDGGRGRHDLSASLAFATHELSERMGLDRVVLAGWSLGANAGLDVVLHSTIIGGWRPAAFVGLSGGFDGSPYHEPDAIGTTADPSVPLLLIHGSADEVVPIERARMMRDQLFSAGWHIRLREVETDHAGAIGTVYDPINHRCVPTDDPARRHLLTDIARWIAAHASST
jgi:predicted esterase